MNKSSVLLILASLFPLPAVGGERPNVVFLIADDHAAYVTGAYGNPKAKTPNIDGLARSGVLFERSFCNSPLCTASRQSFLTGKLPHSVGVTQLRTPLAEDQTTLADVMGSAGYRTASFGKMHFNSKLKHGFEVHLDTPDHREHLKSHPAKPIPEGTAVFPPWKPFQDPASVWLNGSYLPSGAYESDMAGTWFADLAIDYLEERASDKAPFLLFVSWTEPHSPFQFPIEYAGMYDPSQFEVPEVGPEDAKWIPEIFRDLTREQKQHIIASYYTSTAFLDKNVRRVLDKLETVGLSQNTIVVYLGDHGYNLGHHGRFEKHFLNDEAVRAPLIVRAPGVTTAGRRTDALTEFIDLFPTVTELCGIESTEGVEGRSLAGLLRGETETHRDSVFSEYILTEEAMVRTATHKLVYGTGKRDRDPWYYSGVPPTGREIRLYDLEQDPGETHNIADDPAHAGILGALEKEMLSRLQQSPAFEHTEIAGAKDVREQLDWYLAPREPAP